jgi:hypothetical protein
MIVVTIALLVSADKPDTQVIEGSPPSNEQQVSQPVVDYSNSGGYSGNDLYDPSIHEFLWATLQACGPDSHGDDSYYLTMELNCNVQAPEL